MKKFLSLVLSLVMVMSLIQISAGAKDFTDDESITYQEAIDVISTIGVVDGYSDGSFKPTDNLTRGAAAKIICNLVLGPTTAGALTVGVAPFPDVPATHTFAGNIAYCANQGIINGYKDGTFKPGDPLTGNAFMKMLLGALGYKSESEGYTGANWTVNVAKDALGIGLAKDLEGDFNGTKTVTREEACLYAFNTLSATMVEYSSNVTANLGTIGTISMNSPATNVRWSTVGITNDGNIRQDGFVQFAEKYFEKLVKSRTSDDFERPAYTWTWDKNVEIGTYVDDSLLLTDAYTEEVKGGTIYDLIGSTTLKDYALNVYVDGVLWASKEAGLDKSGSDKDKGTNDYRLYQMHLVSAGNAMENTGNGVVTEVYLERPYLSVWDYSGLGSTNKEAGVITICIINTWLAQATSNYSTADKDAAMKVFYNIDAGGSTQSSTKTVKFEDVPAVEGVEKDQFLLVNMSGKGTAAKGTLAKNVPTDFDIVEIAEPEIMEDSTVTKFSAEDKGSGKNSFKKLTTGGTEYKKSKMAFYDADVLDTYDDLLLTGITYNIYMDPYGFFIGVDIFSGTKNYVFITGYDTNNSHIFNSNATAAAIFLDGTMETITVNRTDTNKNIESAWSRATKVGDPLNTDNVANSDVYKYYERWDGQHGNKGITHVNRWYTYSKTSAGVYTLKPVMNNTTGEVRMIASSVVDSTNLEDYTTTAIVNAEDIIKCNNVRLDGVNNLMQTNGDRIDVTSLRAYGEDDSVFIVTENDNVDMRNAATHGYAITGVRGVYTGVQSVELVVTNSDRWHDKDNKPFATIDKTTAIPESVYTVYDKDHYIIGSIIVGQAKGGVDNYAYIIEAPISEEKIDDTYYWEFDCFHQGEKKTLTVKSKYASVAQVLKNSETHVVELQFDGEYVTGVHELEKDNKAFYNTIKAFNQKIDKETVYEVRVARNQPAVAGQLPAYNGELYLQGRTLYVSANQQDKGLTFTSGAKAYVRQEDPRNLGKDKKSVYDSVAEAVDRLTDLDPTTGGKQWSGIIHAALNSNGVAEWVVFDSWYDKAKDDYAANGTDPLRYVPQTSEVKTKVENDALAGLQGVDLEVGGKKADQTTGAQLSAGDTGTLTIYGKNYTKMAQDTETKSVDKYIAGKDYTVTVKTGDKTSATYTGKCTEAGVLVVSNYVVTAFDVANGYVTILDVTEVIAPPPAENEVAVPAVEAVKAEYKAGDKLTAADFTGLDDCTFVSVTPDTVAADTKSVTVTVKAPEGKTFAGTDKLTETTVTVAIKVAEEVLTTDLVKAGNNNKNDRVYVETAANTFKIYTTAGEAATLDEVKALLVKESGADAKDITVSGSSPYSVTIVNPTTSKPTTYTVTNGTDRLYKVTVGDQTYKLAEGMKVTGLTAKAYFAGKTTDVVGTKLGTAVYNATKGEYTAPALAANTTLVPAIEIDKTGVTGATVMYLNADNAPRGLGSSDAIAENQKVVVSWTKGAFKNKGVLSVNGEESVLTGDGTKGQTEAIPVVAGEDGKFTIAFVGNLVTVKIDDEVVTNENTDSSKVFDVDNTLFQAASDQMFYVDDRDYVNEAGAAVTISTANAVNTIDLSSAAQDTNNDGVIELYPAIEVGGADVSGAYSFHLEKDCSDSALSGATSSTNAGKVALWGRDEDGKKVNTILYIKMGAKNTTLKTLDAATFELGTEKAPSQWQEGVYTINLTEDTAVTTSTIAVGDSLVAKNASTDTVADGAAGDLKLADKIYVTWDGNGSAYKITVGKKNAIEVTAGADADTVTCKWLSGGKGLNIGDDTGTAPQHAFALSLADTSEDAEAPEGGVLLVSSSTGLTLEIKVEVDFTAKS